MPSERAAAARDRTAEIMDGLHNGKPGEADAMMGKREPKGTAGIIPVDWIKTKFSGGKKEKAKAEKEGDGVIR